MNAFIIDFAAANGDTVTDKVTEVSGLSPVRVSPEYCSLTFGDVMPRDIMEAFINGIQLAKYHIKTMVRLRDVVCNAKELLINMHAHYKSLNRVPQRIAAHWRETFPTALRATLLKLLGTDKQLAKERFNMSSYWLTPPALYSALNREFCFDFDPCPCPRPDGYNSLVVPWGKMNYVNPPFRRHDGVNNCGPTAFVHKAIAEQQRGHGSVLLLPCQSYVMLLAAAGAEIRSAGRVRFLEKDTGEPWRSPSPCCLFILRGNAPQNTKEAG